MVEMKMLKAIASDNLISRNRARTPADELPMLAQCLVGKPCTTDHNTYNVEKEWATITHAWVDKAATPPSGLDPLNLAVIDREGYQQVRCELSVPDDSPHLLAFERGLRLRVSIQFLYTYPRCPGCTCGENYWHRACPNTYADIQYLERIGVVDAYELSLVVVPAVTSARVLVG
jgi:hypothetical protein